MAMTMGDISKLCSHAAFPREFIMLNRFRSDIRDHMLFLQKEEGYSTHKKNRYP